MNIFCAEALWDKDVTINKTTFLPILKLVGNETGCKVAHFTFNTVAELDYLFKVFEKRKFDVMYIASHMSKGNIVSGVDSEILTDYLGIAEHNKNVLGGKVLHLAGCSSLNQNNVSYEDADDFMKCTGVSILSGYSIDTYTIESASMDLLYLSLLASDYSPKEVSDFINNSYSSVARATGFTIYK